MKSVFALVLACIAGAVQAQADFPSKPLRLIVPFPPGGPTDILGRIIGQEFTARLGHPVVVENRAGATGMIGQDAAAASAPDGHTLVMITSTSSSGYHLLNRSIDFYKDFAMVGQIYSTYSVLVINPTMPGMAGINNLAQLVAYVKANAGKVNYTSTGSGSLGHLTIEKVKMHFGMNMEHINYKGQGPAVQDVLAGRVPILSVTFAIVPQVKAGKLRAIAVGTPKRSALLPDVGTFIEQGVPDLVSGAWVGLAAAGDTPRPIVDRLSNELRDALAKPEMIQKVHATVGTDPEYRNGADFAAYAKRDWEYWGKVIREAGIKGG